MLGDTFIHYYKVYNNNAVEESHNKVYTAQ